MTTTEKVVAWLAVHPHVRRVVTVTASVYWLCSLAVVAAPNAAADAGSAAVAWTGLRDADGIPLQYYFLSMVDTTEAVKNNGQHVSAVDPGSWMSWTAEATQVAVTHATESWWLTNEAALLVCMIGIALWFLRFAMSSAWLMALAQVGRPVFAAVSMLVNQMWLGPLALAVCVTVAGFHYMSGRPARAYNIAGTAAVLIAVLWTVFKNPIDDLVSEHGLLGLGRATGFQIAQAARSGSYAPGQSLQAQLDALMGQLASASVRPALQLQNFGMVIDDVGSCRQAWNRAIMAGHGQGPGPAHAMAGCGAPQALSHAQHLGANDFVLGLLLLFIGFWIALFIWYVGITTLLVGAKATYYAIVVGPAILLGMTGWGRAKSYAIRACTQVLFHAAEMIIFTTFLAVAGVAMGWTLTTPLFGHGAGTVVPRMMVVSIGSIVATLLFHYIDKHFYTDSLGTIGHHINAAWQSARDAARSEYDDFTSGVDKAREARDRFRQWRSRGDDAKHDDGDQDSARPDNAPQLDVVKPRPARRTAPSEADAEPAAPPTASPHTPIPATRAGAVSETGEAVAGAVEGAGTVVAPEVAIPAAAAIAAAQHHRQARRDTQDTLPPSRHPQNSHDDQPLRWPDGGPPIDGDMALPATQRRASGLRPRPAAPADPSAQDRAQEAAGQADAGLRGNPSDDPALEFPSTPAMHSVRPPAPAAKDDAP